MSLRSRRRRPAARAPRDRCADRAAATVAATVAVPSLMRSSGPGAAGRPPSRPGAPRSGRRPAPAPPPRRARRRARHRSRRRGQRDRLAGDRPVRSPSKVTMRATVERPGPTAAPRPRSPGRDRPLAIDAGEAAEIRVRPVDPLHRHAERPPRASARPRPSRDARAASGPRYQGVCAAGRDDVVAAAAPRAGSPTTSRSRARPRSAGYSARSRRNARCDQPTRSILLTASTTWRMPSIETMQRVPPRLARQALARIDAG